MRVFNGHLHSTLPELQLKSINVTIFSSFKKFLLSVLHIIIIIIMTKYLMTQ